MSRVGGVEDQLRNSQCFMEKAWLCAGPSNVAPFWFVMCFGWDIYDGTQKGATLEGPGVGRVVVLQSSSKKHCF